MHSAPKAHVINRGPQHSSYLANAPLLFLGELSKKVDLGGYRVYLHTVQGAPTTSSFRSSRLRRSSDGARIGANGVGFADSERKETHQGKGQAGLNRRWLRIVR